MARRDPNPTPTNAPATSSANDQGDSLLDLNLGDVPEMTVLPEDKEVLIQVERYQKGVAQSGENFVILYFEDPSDPTIKSFSQYYGFGSAKDTPKQKNEKLNRFIDVCRVFDVDHTASPLDLNEFVGKQAYVIVGQREDEKYGVQNTVKSWVKGR